jgi:hypothetical protein
MDLLRQIASSRLPMSFHRTEDIDKVRVLRAAGLVIALIPAPSDPVGLAGEPTAAQVLAVTQKGLEELSKLHDPDRAEPNGQETVSWLRGKLGAIAGWRKPLRGSHERRQP